MTTPFHPTPADEATLSSLMALAPHLSRFPPLQLERQGKLSFCLIRPRDFLEHKHQELFLCACNLLRGHFIHFDMVELGAAMASQRINLLVGVLLLKTPHDEEEVVGAAVLDHKTQLNELLLEYIIVDPRYRDKGFGSYMVNVIKDLANYKKASKVLVWADKGT